MRWLRVLVAGVLMIAFTSAMAVDVRGRIDFSSPYGYFPMTGAQVTFCISDNQCLYYVTGTDGMYYFSAVPGVHRIWVNGIFRLEINIPNRPYFDIAPLMGN